MEEEYWTGESTGKWMPPVECPQCGSINTEFKELHYEMSVYKCLDCGCIFEIEE